MKYSLLTTTLTIAILSGSLHGSELTESNFTLKYQGNNNNEVVQEEAPSTVKKLLDGFYVGEKTQAGGEKLYFGMERVTKENREGLDRFVKLTERFFPSDCRGVSALIKMDMKGTDVSLHTFEESSQKTWGPTNEDYDSTIKPFFEGSEETREARAKRMGTAKQGLSYIHNDVGDYISYISTEPVTAPRTWDLSANSTFSQYMEAQQGLIILVGTRMNVDETICSEDIPETFDNRGVQKTAQELMNGGHPNISMPLHGFTAAVAKEFYGKTTFQVRANLTMRDILRKKLTSKDCKEFNAGMDSGFSIPVDTVIEFYTGKRN